jgi:hypothetical protein
MPCVCSVSFVFAGDVLHKLLKMVVIAMSSVTIKVLSTVNAPYGTNLSAEQLASKISDFASVENFDASAFSFYSELKADLQHQFLDEMEIDHSTASGIAKKFSQLAGYRLALAD